MSDPNRQERLKRANELIGVIASVGRRFFYHPFKYDDGFVEERVSCFMELDDTWRLWFIDGYTQRPIYMHQASWRPWRGFTEGGTLRRLVQDLARYILTGRLLGRHFGPWPDHYCGGDLWAYGADMEKVREAAHRLGIVQPKEPVNV
jgi:hypothetical protein